MATRPWITVVSGLPRSGTSMVMQMLAAGGIEPLMDDARPADPDNSLGYFELDAVKQTEIDASWCNDAAGKAVKVICQLIPTLPERFEYRVIFVRRQIRDVLASQAAILARLGRTGAELTNEKLAKIYTRQIEETDAWINTRPQFRILKIDYEEAIASPTSAAVIMDRFLESGLDVHAMSRVVEPALQHFCSRSI